MKTLRERLEAIVSRKRAEYMKFGSHEPGQDYLDAREALMILDLAQRVSGHSEDSEYRFVFDPNREA